MVQIIFKAKGTVVHGFNRGSKELGIPTANLDDTAVESIPESMQPGVYSGFAQVNDGPVYEMVMSLGWNPFYKNQKKSLEVHILHKFDEDFYDAQLSIVVVHYIRPERDFESLDKLIEEIQNDILITKRILALPAYGVHSNDPIFETKN